MGRRTDTTLRVGTRGSALALRQAELAAAALRAVGPDVGFELVRIRTVGDRVTDRPFEAIGPKGVFAREIQRALLEGEVDVAVHSLKDLPGADPAGLELAAVLEREDPRDVLVSREGRTLDALEPGSRIGTSSSRRRAQLAVRRGDLEAVPLRGNVGTRLDKVAGGEVEAAILAGAGLLRLDRADAVTEWLDPADFLPPPGQGAIVVEARSDRLEGDLGWARGADHADSRLVVETERAFLRIMEGGCEVPLGAWARIEDGSIVCDGFVASPDGAAHLRDRARGTDPGRVGEALATQLRRAGADEILTRGRPG